MPPVSVEYKLELGVHSVRCSAVSPSFYQLDSATFPGDASKLDALFCTASPPTWYSVLISPEAIQLCSATLPDAYFLELDSSCYVAKLSIVSISAFETQLGRTLYAPLGYLAQVQPWLASPDRDLLTLSAGSLRCEARLRHLDYTHVCVLDDLVTLWNDNFRGCYSERTDIVYLEPTLSDAVDSNFALLSKNFTLPLPMSRSLCIQHSPPGVYDHGSVAYVDSFDYNRRYSDFLYVAMGIHRFLVDPAHFPDSDPLLSSQFDRFALLAYRACRFGDSDILKRLSFAVLGTGRNPAGPKAQLLARLELFSQSLTC